MSPYGTVSLKLAADNDKRSLGGQNYALGVYLVPENLSFSHTSDNWSTPQTVVIHSFADDNDSVDEGELGPDNQSFTVWLSSIDDDNASGMLYDDIAQAKINLNPRVLRLTTSPSFPPTMTQPVYCSPWRQQFQ